LAYQKKVLTFQQVQRLARPELGWLRSTRELAGATLAELARRLEVTPPAVRSFEQAEVDDRITLASLRRVAAAMEHDLVYALVPRRPPSAEPAAADGSASSGSVPVTSTDAPSPTEAGAVDGSAVNDDNHAWRKTEGLA